LQSIDKQDGAKPRLIRLSGYETSIEEADAITQYVLPNMFPLSAKTSAAILALFLQVNPNKSFLLTFYL
jgi:hypothetical protein